MKVFQTMEETGCEQVVFCYDKATGLKAIIAIHDTTFGTAIGGCRMRNYPGEEEAFTDAVRLARGMTLKSSAAGLDFGGGKAVIWGDPGQKTEPLLRAMGRFIEGLHGRYITGPDMNTGPKDLAVMHKETRYVLALPEELGGAGDSSGNTALGVYQGIRACLEEVFGSDSPAGKTVAIQGVGNVGRALGVMLAERGARIIAADPSAENLRLARSLFKFDDAAPEEIHRVEADIFSPNAIGAVLNDQTIPELNCKIVAGAANNQLAGSRHGRMLMEKGILYAPDFVINAGGIIGGAAEYYKESREALLARIEQIYTSLKQIFAASREKNIPTQDVAELLAMERVELIGRVKRIYAGRD